MAASGTPFSATFGFLTVVDDPEQGLFGGYLALNAAGRPIEFHCTAPVKANRAQEILYGPTLAPYLEGELIGGALLGRAKSPPLAVFVDRAAALAVRHLVEAPVVLSLSPESDTAAPPRRTDLATIRNERAPADRRVAAGVKLREFRLGENRLAVPSAHADDRRQLEAACAAILAEFDLWEPFSRVREALQEARSAAAGRPSRQAPAA
jgi:hypothetical protein